MRAPTVIACCCLLSLAACAKNPATGKPVLSLVSTDQEIAIGEQAVKDVEASIGLIDDARLQSYVARVGEQMASRSERPSLPWAFAVVDDPAVNAFALPGGKIFVTRGLCAHVDNTAQLATVVGHEIGHVTARHSVQRMSQQELISLGLGLGMVVSAKTRAFVPLASAGLEVLFLKFSRNDEYQADELGVRYASRADYDVRQMPDMFRMLQRVSEQGTGGRLPEWLSTHPEPEHRIEHVSGLIASASAKLSEPRVERAEYLKLLDGLVYGDDPRDGFVREGVFYHPRLGFSIDVPESWKTQNTRAALIMASPQQDVLIQLSAGPVEEPQHALQAFAHEDGVTLQRRLDGVVPELRSASAELVIATQEQGDLAGLVTFVVLDGHTYQLLAVAPKSVAADHMDQFAKVFSTFRTADERRVRDIEPPRLKVIEVPQDMTLAAMYGQQPASIPLARVALLNQLEPESPLHTGQLVKWVTGGTPPAGDSGARGE